MGLEANDLLTLKVVASIMGGLAWIGHTLNTANPLPTRARWIGGTMTACFVTYAACVIYQNTGMNPQMSAVMAALTGSMGEKGLTYLYSKYFSGNEKG